MDAVEGGQFSLSQMRSRSHELKKLIALLAPTVMFCALLIPGDATSDSLSKILDRAVKRSLDIHSLESKRAAEVKRVDASCLGQVKHFSMPRFGSDEELSYESLYALFAEQFGSASSDIMVWQKRVTARALNYQACGTSAGNELPMQLARRQQALLLLTLAFLRPATDAEPAGRLSWEFEGETRDAFGNYVIRIRQTLDGVPVTASSASIVTSPSGVVDSMSARPILMRELNTAPSVGDSARLSEDAALTFAMGRLFQEGPPAAKGEIVFRGPEGLKPAWRFVFDAGDQTERAAKISITVDQISGATLELANVADGDATKYAAAPDFGQGTGAFGSRTFPTDCEPGPCGTSATQEYRVNVDGESKDHKVTVSVQLTKDGSPAQLLTANTPQGFNVTDEWSKSAIDAYASLWRFVETLHSNFGIVPGGSHKLHTSIEAVVDNRAADPASVARGKIYLGRSAHGSVPAGSDQDIVAHEFVHVLMNEQRLVSSGVAAVNAYDCTRPDHVQFLSVHESLGDTVGVILGSLARDSVRMPDAIGVHALRERARSFKDPTKNSQFNKAALETAYKTGGSHFRNAWRDQNYAQPGRLTDAIILPCTDTSDVPSLMYLNTGPLNALAYKLVNDFPRADRSPRHQGDYEWMRLVGRVYLTVGSNLVCESEDCTNFCGFLTKLDYDFQTPVRPFETRFVGRLRQFLAKEGFACR